MATTLVKYTHRNLSTDVTGSTTTAALLEDSPMDALPFRTRQMLWDTGNIDAPELICAGGAKAIRIEGHYECTAVRVVVR